MDHMPLWKDGIPTPHTALPVGAAISYTPEDAEQLADMLAFLGSHLEISENDFGATIDEVDEQHPGVWLRNADMSWTFMTLKRALRDAEGLSGSVVAIGFYDRHLELFRAYRVHLESNAREDDAICDFFEEADIEHFGYLDAN